MTDKKRIATTISVPELFRRFPGEDTCYRWLERVRWNDKPVCPHCGGVENITRPASKPHTYWHRDCRSNFTVTTLTCLHATKRPLRDWIYVIYSVMTGRKGVSAMQLSKELGCQYRTAWHMLHRIREACGRGDFELKDVVEVDETYIGGKRRNMSNAKRKALAGTGRGAVGKTAIAGMRERGGKVKATVVEHTDAATLVGLVEQHVIPRHHRLHRRGFGLQRAQAPLQPRQREAQYLGVCPGQCAHERHGVGLEHSQALDSRHLAPRLAEASGQVRQRGDLPAQ